MHIIKLLARFLDNQGQHLYHFPPTGIPYLIPRDQIGQHSCSRGLFSARGIRASPYLTFLDRSEAHRKWRSHDTS